MALSWHTSVRRSCTLAHIGTIPRRGYSRRSRRNRPECRCGRNQSRGARKCGGHCWRGGRIHVGTSRKAGRTELPEYERDRSFDGERDRRCARIRELCRRHCLYASRRRASNKSANPAFRHPQYLIAASQKYPRCLTLRLPLTYSRWGKSAFARTTPRILLPFSIIHQSPLSAGEFRRSKENGKSG